MNTPSRWILSAVLLLIVGTTGFADEPDQAQEAAIVAIRKLGGFVGLEETSPGRHVFGVSLSGPKFTDEGLKHLNSLSGFTSLYIGGTRVTDAGLKHLAGLSTLESLTLVIHQHGPITVDSVQLDPSCIRHRLSSNGS